MVSNPIGISKNPGSPPFSGDMLVSGRVTPFITIVGAHPLLYGNADLNPANHDGFGITASPYSPYSRKSWGSSEITKGFRYRSTPWRVQVYMTRWWFEPFFIFTPIWGRFPILANIFQMGWNHQLEKFQVPFQSMWNPPLEGSRYTWCICIIWVVTTRIHQEFQEPKMEGFLYLIFGYFGGGETPLHKPYPYSLYRFEDSSILGTWNAWWRNQRMFTNFRQVQSYLPDIFP